LAYVLVVDDDEGHRALARAMLTKLGHEVGEAADGGQGLRLAVQRRPDMVLTDISMPGVDGHALISALRAKYADLPIIAISGGSAVPKDELLAKAVKLGAKEVIMKPFEPGQLAGAVSRALKIKK
jgi:CheY-like chemotaxis protein